MATNRIDILDSALLRPGRIDRKIEFPPPNEEVRQRILYYYVFVFVCCDLWVCQDISCSLLFFFFFFEKKYTRRQGLYFYVYIQNMFLKLNLHVEFKSQFLLNWPCFTGKIGHPEDSLKKDEFNKRHKPQKNCWTHAWLIRSWSEGTVHYIDDQETEFFWQKYLATSPTPDLVEISLVPSLIWWKNWIAYRRINTACQIWWDY